MKEKDQVYVYRLLALRAAVKLEMEGMRRRGRSATAMARDELKVNGGVGRQKLYDMLTEKAEKYVEALPIEERRAVITASTTQGKVENG